MVAGVFGVKMDCHLVLEQTQTLIMTPELRQAITILQLGALELAQYIEQQIMENPVLELEDAEEPEEPSLEASVSVESAGRTESEDRTIEPEWLEYFDDSSDTGYVRSRDDDERPSFEAFVSAAPTLHEHLLLQLHVLPLSGERLAIGEYLVGNIDDNGYLYCDLDETARIFGTSCREVVKVLEIIQGFDPPGVGARSIEECLLIQLRPFSGPVADLAREIVLRYLEDLGNNKYKRIAEALGVTVLDVQDAADLIRTLDPKPGRWFGGRERTRYIIPDVTVRKVGGEYVVIMNDNAFPRLFISPYYKRLLSSGCPESPVGADTKKFIENKIHSALWFLKSIEQRRLTLYRVVETMVHLQRDFFDRGLKHLRPMTLRQVASIVGVHESTVSRAVANKFVQTPHGVFELRFFFASGVETQDGGLSSESIKKMIQDLVSKEDSREPLSDQAIADSLNSKGIAICRRTVAKYRQEAGIPPSRLRKRY